MSWITLTEDDVLTRLAGAEVNAYKTVALGDTQNSPLPEIMADTIAEVRGYIAACAENQLGAPGTIPPQLKQATLNIIRNRLADRLPGIRIDDNRQRAESNAFQMLRDVAACRISLTQPDTVTDENLSSGSVEVASQRTRVARNSNLSGL